MPLRLIAPLILAALLSGCAGQPESKALSPVEPSPEQTRPQKPAPLPADMHELSGRLHGIPPNSTVELALLLVDNDGLPQGLLAASRLDGTGQTLPFQLRFAPQSADPALHLELHGRASRSGRLIMRLPTRSIPATGSLTLGDLRLVPAP